MKKINLIYSAMLAIALCFTACSSDDNDIEVVSLTLNETSLSLIVGDEFTLTATVLPNNATSQHVTWTSSDDTKVSIVNGVVTAIAAGNATITAKAGDKTATCQVSIITDRVTINGVVWATRNVDMPNTFAATPESYGMYYQWGRKIAWSENDPLIDSNGGTTWDDTDYAGETWTAENDPSPAGWRLPTLEECESLLDETKVTSEWTTQNGVDGRKFTDIATGASIFLSAAGVRNTTGSLYDRGKGGWYWSSTVDNASFAHTMYFGSAGQYTYTNFKSLGFSVRCVAK